jgi:hypothetical protein
MFKALLVGAALCCAAPAMTHAHDWYSDQRTERGGSCCNGEDCAQVKGSLVEERRGFNGEGGWYFLLDKGDHPQVFSPSQFFVPYGKLRPSPDGKWHICIIAGWVLCAFGPVGGS